MLEGSVINQAVTNTDSEASPHPQALVGMISGGQIGTEPFDPTSWSGSSKAFFEECQDRGLLRHAFGVDIPKWQFYTLAARFFHPNRDAWRYKLYSSIDYRRALEKCLPDPNDQRLIDYPIVQLGAYVNTPRVFGAKSRVFTFQDGNNFELVNSGFAPEAIKRFSRITRRCFDYEREVAHSAEKVFTTSEYLRKSFIENYGISEKKVKTIGCGINFMVPEKSVLVDKDYSRKELLFLGKEFYRKGGDVVCKAFRKVRLSYPRAILNIVGPPEVPTEFRGDSGIRHHGFLNNMIPDQRQLLYELLRNATLLVMPSRYEPFGIAPLEAMTYGTPAIVTNRWALAENIRPGENGFHVEMNNDGQLAEIIIEAWSNPSCLRELGSRARDFVEAEFTWKRVVDRMLPHIFG